MFEWNLLTNILCKNNEILSLYPYTSIDSVDSNNIRYNLLPNETKDVCHRDVGTFPSKRVMLDDKTELEIFDKYWKYDKQSFIEVWKAAGGNISKLSDMLDVSRVTLYRYLKKYGLTKPE